MTHSDSLEYQLLFEFFDDVVGIENTDILNGPRHIVPFSSSGTHPFYNFSGGAKGNLVFAGQPYFNVTLSYDIYSDELVIQQLRATGIHELIVLKKVNVETFRPYGHNFKNYQGAKAQDVGLGNGFYDVLYESPAFTLLATRKKYTRVDMGRLQYENEDKYLLIRRGRKSTPIRGLKGFYKVLGDQDLRTELRNFVKTNSLNIMQSEPDLIETARYCATISGNKK